MLLLKLTLSRTKKKLVDKNGFVFVGCHWRWGEHEATFDLRPYLRESTVRRLNRARAQGKRLSFQSKYHLARAILSDLKALLPAGLKVYGLFDSWYASAKLIQFCRRQGWHVLCALKSNRTLDGEKVSLPTQRQQHQRYQIVNTVAADGTEVTGCALRKICSLPADKPPAGRAQRAGRSLCPHRLRPSN